MRFTTSLTPAASLLALGLSLQAEAADYKVGPQSDGSIVVSTNQILTPTGKVVPLGAPVRAKAVALNPKGGTGAVLLMGDAPVKVFDLATGKVIQAYSPPASSNGSYGGLTYSADGQYLYFSQDSSFFSIAKVAANGTLSNIASVPLPPDSNIKLYSPSTAYPGGISVSTDGKSAYVLLNQNNTLGFVDLTASPPALKKQVRVGNVPNSILLNGNLAYISNEGGRAIQPGDQYWDISSGTQIVTSPTVDTASTGTISVVDVTSGKVVTNIDLNAGAFAGLGPGHGQGLHPTGMALAGAYLFVANAFSETVSVININSNKVERVIHVSVPVGVPSRGAYGTAPCAVAVDGSILYVAEAAANAIAVIDVSGGARTPILGYIPTFEFPTTIAIDHAHRQLVVSNDKGVGTQGDPKLGLIGTKETDYGVTSLNTHQDVGVVNLIPIPTRSELPALTRKVFDNNHWTQNANIRVGPEYVDANAKPKALPDHIGEPSFIKHVFLIIKENRTYDQLFGDIKKGNGDPTLAVFAASTPNQHALATRWPLFDNTYAPSRQSADGHPWIVSGIAAYSDEIQSPDWVRSYPGGNSNDAMVYTPRGFLWESAKRNGLTAKLYGEWSGLQTVSNAPDGTPYTWSDFFTASQILEGNCYGCTTTITPATVTETTTVPSAAAILDPHYPSFNTGIPDQYRVDYWLPIFNKQVKTGTVPALTIMWLPDDHGSGYSPGYPTPTAAQADNDLALGRIVEAISHSPDWKTSAIFVEEDDAQNGVDHVDGHRQPVFAIGPYVRQDGYVDSTIYTAANINRTIEQILGLTPLTQFDLVATPMRAAFTDTPDFRPYTHLPPTVPLGTFPSKSPSPSSGLEAQWEVASLELFKDKFNKADAVDANTLNHVLWYASTDFKKPYPGETSVRAPSEFNLGAKPDADNDGDGD